jgi:hypothetical protein
VGKHSKKHVEATAAVGDATVTPGKVGIRSAILAGAALSVATAVTAVAATQPESVAALSMELAAVVTPANSTAQIFAGTAYYGNDYTDPALGYGQQQVIPFFLGPQGIADAVKQANGEPTVILASGWGAGQTGTALGMLSSDDLKDVELVILDNNSNRAGGGFWTTYAPFAPLLVTSAEPTPNTPGVPVLDVAYEYNINSDAPTYPINLLADANSLAAYAYGYGAQSTAKVPQVAMDEAKNTSPTTVHHHYIVDSEGNIVGTPTPLPDSNITYVTVQSDGLPLVRPLRSIPGGDVVADAVEPTLTVLVNWGYKDNQPIPTNPGETRPMGLFPSAEENNTAIAALPGALGMGVQAAQHDLSSPSTLLTTPSTAGLPTGLASAIPSVGTPPDLGLPKSTSAVVPTTKDVTPKPSTTNKPLLNLRTGNGNMFKPGGTANTSATGGGTDPISSTLKSVSDFNTELTKAVQNALKPSGTDTNATSNPGAGS